MDTYVQSQMNVLEATAGCFEVVWTGMVIVVQMEDHNWSEVGPGERG